MLNWAGASTEITALMAMLWLPTDMTPMSAPEAWGGAGAGRHTEKKYYFLPPEPQAALKGISFL